MEETISEALSKTSFRKVVVIGVRDLWCAIDMKHVTEVSSLLKITNVPWTAEHVLGVSNLRGNIISIVDVGMILGRDPCVLKSTSRIVVCKAENILTGLLADSMFEILDVDEAAIDATVKARGTAMAEFINGEFEYDKRIVTILNMQSIAGKLRADKDIE